MVNRKEGALVSRERAAVSQQECRRNEAQPESNTKDELKIDKNTPVQSAMSDSNDSKE